MKFRFSKFSYQFLRGVPLVHTVSIILSEKFLQVADLSHASCNMRSGFYSRFSSERKIPFQQVPKRQGTTPRRLWAPFYKPVKGLQFVCTSHTTKGRE